MCATSNWAPTFSTTLALPVLPLARPNEPELLVNGRQLPTSIVSSLVVGQQQQQQQLLTTFKEGAQVKLECQSAGGRPAPRIEWLNVSSLYLSHWQPSGQNFSPKSTLSFSGTSQQQQLDLSGSSLPMQIIKPADVQLLRALWPHKKTTYTIPSSLSSDISSSSSSSDIPLTSSSVTILLSRYDLQSKFVCLVLPQTYNNQQQNVEQQLIRNPVYLSGLLNQQLQQYSSNNHQVSGSASANGRQQAQPMVKWLNLNVQG